MTGNSLDFVLMRGGTSKGVFLRAESLPSERRALQAVLLDLFGSPDRRQIDGLGGADKLTSKAAIIGPPIREETDVTYLFGQVGIFAPEVDFNLNCGNLTAAVGVYAIEEGWVTPQEGMTLVRVHNVNTDRVVHVHVPVAGGRPVSEGDLHIDGVPGTGAPIGLDFSRAYGAITGKLLPLEEATSRLMVPGVGSIEVSVIDGANLVIYARAEALGLTGTESPEQIDGDTECRARLDALRQVVAYRVGLQDYWDARRAPSTPMLVLLQSPRDYQRYTSDDLVPAESMDLVCRQYASGSVSKTLAATVTATTGMACGIGDSLPARMLSRVYTGGLLALGHPSGVIQVDAQMSRDASGWHPTRARIERTARRLAEGKAFLKRSQA